MIGAQDLPQRRDHEEFELLMMGHLDDELSPDLEQRFQEHLESCADCARELVRYRELAEVAQAIRLREPQDHELERFWQVLYNRMERRSGWILILVGVILLTAFLVYEIAITDLLHWWIKIGVASLAIGFLILFVSVFRARQRTLPYDPYRRVQR